MPEFYRYMYVFNVFFLIAPSPQVFKTFFVLNSAELEIYPAHKMLKCQQLLTF